MTNIQVRARFDAWVESMRQSSPSFWPQRGRKGPPKNAQVGNAEQQRRKRVMLENRDEGKAWAGGHHGALMKDGFAYITDLRGKAYWPRLLAYHEE